eukprot:TRINITY_DN56283_c0_g1_i1.p1 TRINITY_DN56283_c0_g1~~TRINITY_DN56283_c0_g1_i1.p1  ORF type:complete len:285 (+),score=82.42 TRINITY_DN56283_c0_g1_i1:81-935(+)
MAAPIEVGVCCLGRWATLTLSAPTMREFLRAVRACPSFRLPESADKHTLLICRLEKDGKDGSLVATDEDLRDAIFLKADINIRRKARRPPRRAVVPTRTDLSSETQRADRALGELPPASVATQRRYFSAEELAAGQPGDLVAAAALLGVPPDPEAVFDELGEPAHVTAVQLSCGGADFAVVGLKARGAPTSQWRAFEALRDPQAPQQCEWREAWHWDGRELRWALPAAAQTVSARRACGGALRLLAGEVDGAEGWELVLRALRFDEAAASALSVVDPCDFRPLQ